MKVHGDSYATAYRPPGLVKPDRPDWVSHWYTDEAAATGQRRSALQVQPGFRAQEWELCESQWFRQVLLYVHRPAVGLLGTPKPRMFTSTFTPLLSSGCELESLAGRPYGFCLVQCCFTSTRETIIWTIRDAGKRPRTSTSTFTQLSPEHWWSLWT